MKPALNFFLALIFTLGTLSAKSFTPTFAPKSDSSSRFKQSKLYKHKKLVVRSMIALGYAGAAFGSFHCADRDIQMQSQEIRTSSLNKVSDHVSKMGEGSKHFMASGGLFAAGYLMRDVKLQKTAFLWASTLIVNDAFSFQLKRVFQRHRPNTGNAPNTFDGFEGPGENTSFPSAHSSTAFATATVFATMYRDKKWVPPLAYGMASLVAASRVYNNVHWCSDIMVGAAVGFLSAKGVMGLYNLANKKMMVVIPQLGSKYNGLQVMYKF